MHGKPTSNTIKNRIPQYTVNVLRFRVHCGQQKEKGSFDALREYFLHSKQIRTHNTIVLMTYTVNWLIGMFHPSHDNQSLKFNQNTKITSINSKYHFQKLLCGFVKKIKIQIESWSCWWGALHAIKAMSNIDSNVASSANYDHTSFYQFNDL